MKQIDGFGGQPSFGLISELACLGSTLLAVFSLFTSVEASFIGLPLELIDARS
jgi:hypothetical protein